MEATELLNWPTAFDYLREPSTDVMCHVTLSSSVNMVAYFADAGFPTLLYLWTTVSSTFASADFPHSVNNIFAINRYHQTYLEHGSFVNNFKKIVFINMKKLILNQFASVCQQRKFIFRNERRLRIGNTFFSCIIFYLQGNIKTKSLFRQQQPHLEASAHYFIMKLCARHLMRFSVSGIAIGAALSPSLGTP